MLRRFSIPICFILFFVFLPSIQVVASQSVGNQTTVLSSQENSSLQQVIAPETFIDATTGIEFVLIKGGCFQMGSPLSEEGRSDDEGPLHEVCLDDFWMGRHEVTNSQYRLYVTEHDSKNHNDHNLNGEMQPVVHVNWSAATDYATWLSQQSAKKIRLPTEEEWEYAARGLSTTAQYWGEGQVHACDYANVGDQSAKQNGIGREFHNCNDGYPASAAVGSFRPNAYGLYDMLGNVWEWTEDLYRESYNEKSQVNITQNPSSKIYRVLRGGSWFSDPRNIRAARRSWYRTDSHNDSLGFRLVSPVK